MAREESSESGHHRHPYLQVLQWLQREWIKREIGLRRKYAVYVFCSQQTIQTALIFLFDVPWQPLWQKIFWDARSF
jgi:hypothetical protein